MDKLTFAGARFGRLVLLGRAHRDKKLRRTFWICRCDCGKEVLAPDRLMRSGAKKSCGCLQVEARRARKMIVGKRRTKNSWDSMIVRCRDPNHRGYKNYGGRGITVCERWVRSFDTFLSDMGERPIGRSIGRIDNAGNYEPGNCRWETSREQHDNRRVTVWSAFHGERETLRVACLREGMSYGVVKGRLANGWSEQDAFSRPVRPRRKNRTKEEILLHLNSCAHTLTSMKRTAVVSIMVSDTEKQRLVAAAQADRRSLSAWARQALLKELLSGRPPDVRP